MYECTWLHGNRNKEIEEIASYSIYENLSQKNFANVPDDEVEELMQTIKALSRRLAAHINRRYEKDNRINLPDLRRTLRKNMRRGGELLEIAFRKPKRNRTKLVVICDVSRSMELYAAFLLQFMYAFQQVYSRVETFAFSTSLQQITLLLKQNDFHQAMNLLSEQNEKWSGGTRIGKSLNSFVNDHALKVLDKKTIVVIMSDGWDTGDIDLLKHSMEMIHNRSKKVIWLNPLAGFSDYKPHVEIFADEEAHKFLKDYPYLKRATGEDFGREFLSLKCAVKVVDNIDEALSHIQQYSTKHSEAIVSENKDQCERFLQEVDAAAVYSNASTRFTDGEEFGLGAEIGISTQKLHARGPFALEKLVTEKWIIRGDGQVR